MCFLSNASCNKRTISCPTAFFAAKPLVQVRSVPESSASCSTGKENVRPRFTTGESALWSSACEEREAGIAGEVEAAVAGVVASVRKASTESAR